MIPLGVISKLVGMKLRNHRRVSIIQLFHRGELNYIICFKEVKYSNFFSGGSNFTGQIFTGEYSRGGFSRNGFSVLWNGLRFFDLFGKKYYSMEDLYFLINNLLRNDFLTSGEIGLTTRLNGNSDTKKVF